MCLVQPKTSKLLFFSKNDKFQVFYSFITSEWENLLCVSLDRNVKVPPISNRCTVKGAEINHNNILIPLLMLIFHEFKNIWFIFVSLVLSKTSKSNCKYQTSAIIKKIHVTTYCLLTHFTMGYWVNDPGSGF